MMDRFNSLHRSDGEVSRLSFLNHILVELHNASWILLSTRNDWIWLITEPRLRCKSIYTDTEVGAQFPQDVNQYIASLSGRKLVNKHSQMCFCLCSASFFCLEMGWVHSVDTQFNRSPLHWSYTPWNPARWAWRCGRQTPAIWHIPFYTTFWVGDNHFNIAARVSQDLWLVSG
jgi:hypothetical protein